MATPAAGAAAASSDVDGVGGAVKSSGASSLDAYEVLSVIGKGSFGTVAKIRRKTDARVLVWKELNYGSMREKEKQLVVSEVNILRELRHPFIVRYYDRIIDKASTRLYIVMEYAEGGDLGGLIKRHKKEGTSVDEEFVWHVFTQCVVALKECHRHMGATTGKVTPILHRDIKPGNIFMDASNNIKIGDFGLAKELGSESKFAYTNVGTPFYMSPEMINEMRYNEKSDIWALGCLLYELCALAPPFDAANHLSLAVKINAGKFNRIPIKYSEDLHRVIRWMLNVDSTKRPAIEELEKVPRIRAGLPAALAVVKEYSMNSSFASKARELKAKEEELAKREVALAAAEKSLKEKEAALAARTAELSRREAGLAARLGTLADEESRRYSMGDRLRPPTASSTTSTASSVTSTGIAFAPSVAPPMFRAHSMGDVTAPATSTAASLTQDAYAGLRRARSMSTSTAVAPPLSIAVPTSGGDDTPGTAMDTDHVEVVMPRTYGFPPSAGNPATAMYSRPASAGAENAAAAPSNKLHGAPAISNVGYISAPRMGV